MKKALSIAGVIGISIFMMFSHSLGQDRWTNIGPEGGSVLTMAIDPHNPQVIYAGTSSGLSKSIDGGGNWKKLTGNQVFSLPVNRKNPEILYAVMEQLFEERLPRLCTWHCSCYSSSVEQNVLEIAEAEPTGVSNETQ